ncbi:uncharacterized protein LOC135936629 isoform X1 [Cloeon dipterum]|uniref:uncharacterized protein LOC135936629 isoform X1 n=1 Tax=Cloeon dipterum TaxID=197152 RepID=UPI003220947F
MLDGSLASTKSVTPSLESNPLRCLDLFCGCGGLSLGLEMSHLTTCLWAVDADPTACKSFAANFRQATVYQSSAIDWLKELKTGALFTKKGQKLPQTGEVEMIIGGPPCQGFSKLNRFKNNNTSVTNKSQVPVFLEIVAYFRPKCFLMENVKSFITEDGGKHFLAALQATKDLGYYFNFNVLQAADFGAPQQRPRFFLFGTLDSRRLAAAPISTHYSGLEVTSVKAASHTLSFTDKQEAYFQKVTVHHAIADLPDVEPQESGNKISYNSINSTFQFKMRNGSDTLRLHKLPTSLNPDDQKRITMIPPGSDWRCLPQSEHEECFKTFALTSLKIYLKLIFLFSTSIRGMPLAPKSLVKSSRSNGDWKGAYGRLRWSDLFMTVLTRPTLASKTGTIIHPIYNRTLTIREFARAQTFPDNFKFKGTIAQVQRQVAYLSH